jgi:predicted ATPase
MIMMRDIQQYDAVSPEADIVFFDRSLLDSLGMMAQLGQVPDADKSKFLTRYPYHSTAFILPPWREIYRTDTERDQSFDNAVSVYHSLRDWYMECGYNLIEVPAGTINQRCEFVLHSLKEGRGLTEES